MPITGLTLPRGRQSWATPGKRVRWLALITPLAACEPVQQPDMETYANNPVCLFWCRVTTIDDSAADSPTLDQSVGRVAQE